MINTRLSIYTSLKSLLNKLTKLAQYNPKGFKTILYAVILNDMKEWSEYIPTDDSAFLVDLLERYILCHPEFKIERFLEEERPKYVNVNTPQDNTTWDIIDNKIDITLEKNLPSREWEDDPNCRPELVFWPGDPRDKICDGIPFTPGPYKIDYYKMTTCEKMNVYLNQENGKYYYLDHNGCWQEISSGTGGGCTRKEVEEIILGNHIKVTPNDSDIAFTIASEEVNNKINLATDKDLEGIL